MSMIDKNTVRLLREGRHRLTRFYRYYGNVGSLLKRLKFHNLRRQFYKNLWSTAAENVGATWEPWFNGYNKICRDGMMVPVYLTQVNLNNILLDKILLDKEMTQDLLKKLGCPIPQNATFNMAELATAEAFLERHKTVVVKPASDAAGGGGVTTNISDIEALKQAAKTATHHSSKLLIEEFVEGCSYRLLYVGGKFIDAVLRGSPTVTGDGNKTIRQLIKAENTRRLTEKPISSLQSLQVDGECRSTLKNQGLSLNAIPAAGDVVVVKKAVNASSAGQNHNVIDQVHPETIELGASIMRNLDITLGGIDIQTTDISRPLDETGGRILEINSPPGIHHHYFLADPERGQPIAEMLLEYMFTNSTGVIHLTKEQLGQ